MRKLKILTVFGTRPEVIKLAPFIKAVEADKDCLSITCATTQHRKLQHDILELFKINIDHDLDVMEDGQDLFHITESILKRIKTVLGAEKPDFTVVQGDTTTAFTAALSSFYRQIPVVHIEAGLRTGDLYSPYPEEANRTLISRIAALHMAPTQQAVDNLAKENITKNVYHTGNTIVDAVEWILTHGHPQDPKIQEFLHCEKNKVLITVHRRENFGESLKKICNAIRDLTKKYPEYRFIWPVHPNPSIQHYVHQHLQNLPNLCLLEPLSYADLINLINKCVLILSDSGGIQEEACILEKNILILRSETERPEVIESGYGVLVSPNYNTIVTAFDAFISNKPLGQQKGLTKKIYGEPGVGMDILDKIKRYHSNG